MLCACALTAVALAGCAVAATPAAPSATAPPLPPTLTAKPSSPASATATVIQRAAPEGVYRPKLAQQRTPQPIPAQSTPWQWSLPPGVPLPLIPADNPMTVERVELGRHLFYDIRLSGNGTQSCATCHAQALAFTDGRRTSTGSTGEAHPRNAQALVNVAYNSTLTWANPVLTELERQVQIPMFGEFPVELGITGREESVLAALRADPRYAALFAAAFPGETEPMGFTHVVKALSAFTRALTSFNSPYDRFVYGGDRAALSPAAQRGMRMFLSEDLKCHHCHTGFNFSQSTQHEGVTFIERPFFNTGLYNLGGSGAYPADNTGLYALTNDPLDMGKFRPPTLRNVARSGPYMHDGSLETLDDVVAFYARGGRLIESGPNAGDGKLNKHKNGLVSGFTLTPEQKADLIAFLESLTDEGFLKDRRFSDPFAAGPP